MRLKKHKLMKSVLKPPQSTPKDQDIELDPDWEKELEARFKDMFNLIEVTAGMSERENLKSFIKELLQKEKTNANKKTEKGS